MPGKEHVKMVIWPREDQTNDQGETLYRYAVVGMIVRDTPMNLEGETNETVIEGATFLGVGDLLGSLPKREPTRRLGDANDVLVSLKDL